MVGFQLRLKPLRKLKANFRDLESNTVTRSKCISGCKRNYPLQNMWQILFFGNVILCHLEKLSGLHSEEKNIFS